MTRSSAQRYLPRHARTLTSRSAECRDGRGHARFGAPNTVREQCPKNAADADGHASATADCLAFSNVGERRSVRGSRRIAQPRLVVGLGEPQRHDVVSIAPTAEFVCLAQGRRPRFCSQDPGQGVTGVDGFELSGKWVHPAGPTHWSRREGPETTLATSRSDLSPSFTGVDVSAGTSRSPMVTRRGDVQSFRTSAFSAEPS